MMSEMTDWNNEYSMVSKYFSVREAIYLPTWKRLATPDDGLNEEIKGNLIVLCQKLDDIRELMGAPIIVHCMYRPPEYSIIVGGTETDVHTKGMACDFNVAGLNSGAECDQVRILLLPSLEELGMRMENNAGGAWVHLDTHPVINQRFFLA